jgi:hypothetical protein
VALSHSTQSDCTKEMRGSETWAATLSIEMICVVNPPAIHRSAKKSAEAPVPRADFDDGGWLPFVDRHRIDGEVVD